MNQTVPSHSIFKKSLASLVLLLCFAAMAVGQPWTYNFGTVTGNYNTSNTPSTTFLNSLTPTPSGGGTYRVRMSNGTGGGFVVANPGTSLGSAGELQITAPTNSSTNKLTIYGWNSPSPVAYVKFDLRTTSTANGTFAIQLGDGTVTTGNDNQSYTAGYNAAITSLSITYASGAINTVIRRNGGGNTTITSSGFAKDTDQSIEIYANNGSGSVNYSRSGTYTLPSRTWDLWVAGTKISATPFATAGTWAAGNNISGIGFFTETSTGNVGVMYLDNIEYSNALPAAAFTLTYNGNGNTGGTAPVDGSSPYNGGSNVTVLGPGTLERTGYDFAGWNTAANGTGTPYSAGSTLSNISANTTLYAQWTIKTFTVTYNGNGNDNGTAPVDGSSPYNYGSDVTVLGPGTLTKSGYNFNGWNTAADGSGTPYGANSTLFGITGNVTLYAQWNLANTYSVNYFGNGNTGGSVPVDGSSPYTGGANVTVLGPGTLERTGYTFAGWNTESNGSGTPYNANDVVSNIAATLNLYAQWTINTYTVTYNGNGNDGGDVPSDPNSPYDYNSNVTVLGAGNMTLTNNNFNGWNTAADGSGTPYAAGATITGIASNITLYAQWSVITYTVTYNGNTNSSGTAPVDPSSPYVIGSNVTVLGQGSLLKTGHTFNGWNTAANGSGTPYSAGSTINNLSANAVLYAQWSINSYTVTYDGNGNTGGSAPVDGSSPYNFGSTVTVLANTGNLTKTGYIFLGWNTAADGNGTSYNASGTATFNLGAANVVLYANWALPFYEGFDYTVGSNVGGTTSGTSSNNWTNHSGTGAVTVTSGSLNYTGLQASTGNKVRLPGSNGTVSSDINRAISVPSGSTVAYYSMLLNVADNAQLNAGGDYFAGFGGTSGSSVTSLFARLFAKSSGSGYQLGITNNSGTGTSTTYYTTDLSFGTTYLVVVKHDFNGTSNDISSLWVNPASLGGAEPTANAINSGSATSVTGFASVFLRNGTNTPKVDIDEVRAGTTWAAVTPAVTYQLTTTAGTGGTITAPAVSPLTVNQGAATTITAAANSGYNFSGWTVESGSAVIADANAASTTVTLNSGDATVKANFVASNFTITATAQTSGGSITPAGAVTVSPGANQTFTITPDPCNDIAEVIVDGTISLGAVTTYTFENVDANHTIDVYFNPSTSTTWTGTVNSNWDEPGNWSSCVPDASFEVTIAAGTPNAPVLNVDAEVNSLTISDNATLSLGNKSLTINGGFNGSSLSTLTGSDGASLVLNSSATLISSAPIRLKNLVINGGTTTLASALEITGGTASSGPGEVSIISGALLESNGFLTIKSNQYGTARVAPGDDAGNYITGDVTVERYIPNNGFRSWRFLSVPTFGSQTIRQAWQEGTANTLPLQNNLPGYGTLITGTGTTAAATAAGFDGALANASFQIWGTSNWVNVSGTNTPIATEKGYMLFVRGDRSRVINGAVTNTNATTLRTKGELYQGTHNYAAFPANSFNAVGNLYASAIDFTQLQRTGGTQNLFYIWDSKKQNGTSLGAYQTFSATNGFECTISGGSYVFGAPNTKIESGQAFFVSTTTAGTLTLTEGSKIANGASLGFRPVSPASLVRLTSRLYAAGSNDILDANVVVFNGRYSNEVAAEDALKMTNPEENFGVKQGNAILSVEGRSPVTDADAIQFNTANLKQRVYELELVPQNLQGMEAILEDSYLQTSTPVSLEANTRVSFTVDANPASAAANRFRVVLRKLNLPAGSKAAYTVAPNPVENGMINLQFNNRPAGQYSIRLLSSSGQPLLVKAISHAGGSATQTLRLGKLASGMYMMEITAPGKIKSVERVLVK